MLSQSLELLSQLANWEIVYLYHNLQILRWNLYNVKVCLLISQKYIPWLNLQVLYLPFFFFLVTCETLIIYLDWIG